MKNSLRCVLPLFTSLFIVSLLPLEARAQLRVGAAVTDVTPLKFPVLVNGGMVARSISVVHTKVSARALVIESGENRIAMVVVDSCMIPRPLCDEAKQLASQRTRLRPDQIMISATHSHTAPASMGCLGTDADPTYVPYLREKLAEAIAAAEKNLESAEIGWGSADAAKFTALRRWVRRPDRIANDPFGNPTVRANMHAASNWDDVTGESGPEDPELGMIAFRSKSGRPLAVLANFSMHYFGDRDLSADYFGLFSEGFKAQVTADEPAGDHPPFVGILSHGCSGDIWRRDYAIPADKRDNPTIDAYTNGLLEIALAAYESIEYRDDADVAMAERRMTLNYRVPDQQRLEWAQKIIEEMGDRPLKTQVEVYAREQLILHERQSTEIVLQAIRIGDIAIATTPNETYALTGLKIKLQSPVKHTMVIELANGGDGYIPPPEQHVLGGYNTWAARSAGLEVQAEPKIVESSLQLLEKTSGRERDRLQPPNGPAVAAILDAKPAAYWQLDEVAGPIAVDSSPFIRNAHFEDGVAFFLPGAEGIGAEGIGAEGIGVKSDAGNRAAHFAGGRLHSRFGDVGEDYSVVLWCWNGLPLDARETTGWLVSRDHPHGVSAYGDHLGVSGGKESGRLKFQHGANLQLTGKTQLERWKWYQVAVVRRGTIVTLLLNGEVEASGAVSGTNTAKDLFVGGRSDNQDNWEGRIDEVAVFDRALTLREIKSLAP